MEDLIPVINKLQDVFSAIGQQSLDLPQIVVVGSQSSGKSSVLESLVGRDFLPRGSGVVTRRPLVLQLYCTKNGTEDVEQTEEEEWGEFLHLPSKRFYDFSEIREEIQRETERTTGRNKGISNQTINLKIYSPFVLNLTVVDLPGVTRVPSGDQPEDIEEQIRNMCLDFISNPNAVILAVSAANQDISNSDGLQLALTADPEGLRTIGVVTKVDIMDQGTDAIDILSNRVHPLKRGYVAVVNRSQKDIQDNMTVRDGLAKENAYFRSHPKYRSYLSKCGATTLTAKLNQILMHHIRECLPGIKSKISIMLTEVQSNLDSLGESGDDLTVAKQGEKLLKVLSNFATSLNDFVDGKGSDVGVEMEELCGGARIMYLFNEVFARRLMAVNPFDTLRDQDIQTAMANSNGVRHPLFIPESSFDLLVKKQISRLDQPGLQCVDLVYDEMIRMCLQVDATELNRFPVLRDRVFEAVHQLLRECVKPTQQMIVNLVKVELAHINTSHPDFIGGKRAILAQQQQQQQQQMQQQVHKPQAVGSDGTTMPSSAESSAESKATGTVSPPPITSQQGAPSTAASNRSTASMSGTGSQASSQDQGTVAGVGGFFNLFKAGPSASSSQAAQAQSPMQRNRPDASQMGNTGMNENLIRLKQVVFYDSLRIGNY